LKICWESSHFRLSHNPNAGDHSNHSSFAIGHHILLKSFHSNRLPWVQKSLPGPSGLHM
jgi:hypothetical protein